MEFFRDTNIDFMKYRRVFAGVSAVALVVTGGLVFAGKGLNLGIDFAGGTQLTVKFAEEPQIEMRSTPVSPRRCRQFSMPTSPP